MDKIPDTTVKSYQLPLAEVHRLYGKPGECKDEAPPIPIDGLVQRREARRNHERVPTEEK